MSLFFDGEEYKFETEDEQVPQGRYELLCDPKLFEVDKEFNISVWWRIKDQSGNLMETTSVDDLRFSVGVFDDQPIIEITDSEIEEGEIHATCKVVRYWSSFGCGQTVEFSIGPYVIWNIKPSE